MRCGVGTRRHQESYSLVVLCILAAAMVTPVSAVSERNATEISAKIGRGRQEHALTQRQIVDADAGNGDATGSVVRNSGTNALEETEERCMAPSIEDAMHVSVSDCDASGKRKVDTSYSPSGHQGCKNNLVHPKAPKCTRECGEGHALLWHKTDRSFTCQKCPAGTFSVGGGRIQQHWPLGLPAEFESTCFSLDSERFTQYGNEVWRERVDCAIWTVNAEGTAITSGNNSLFHNIETYLILQLRFVRPGALWFRYRVDAEEWADGLSFRVDDEVLPLQESETSADSSSSSSSADPQGMARLPVSRVPDARMLKVTVGVGWHTFKWMYVKDVSRSVGADKAELLEVGYNGTQFAAIECEACPAGHTSTRGSARCTGCGRNEVWSESKGKCSPCPPGTYALAGFSACLPLPACTRDDYGAVYTPCAADRDSSVSPTRDLRYEWVELLMCSPTAAGAAALPPPETAVPCQACNPGLYLAEDGRCKPCAPGFASPGGATACRACPAGSEAHLSLFLSQFDLWPGGMTTGCEGECGSEGWRQRGAFLDAGTRHGVAEVWLTLEVVLSEPGRMAFQYELPCLAVSPENIKHFVFFVQVDDGEAWQACRSEQGEVGPNAEGFEDLGAKYTDEWPPYHVQEAAISLAPGRHVIRWVFSQKVVQDRRGRRLKQSRRARRGEGGGATACTPCGRNTFAPRAGSPKCLPCGANTFSEPGSFACNQDCTVDLDVLGEGVGEGRGGVPQPDEPESALSGYGWVWGGEGGGGGVLDLEPLRSALPYMSPVTLQAGDTGGGGQGGGALGARSISLAICGALPGNNSCMASTRSADPFEDTWGVSVCGEPRQDDKDDQKSSISPRLPLRLGSLMSLSALPAALRARQDGRNNTGLTIKYDGGEYCLPALSAKAPETARWKTEVHIVCDLSKGVGRARPLDVALRHGRACTLELVWESQHGCPLCRLSDYKTMGGNCLEGYMDVVYSRSRECYGGVSEPAAEKHVACHALIAAALPLWVVALIALGLLFVCILVSALGYYVVLYRRMYREYEQLELGDALGALAKEPYADDLPWLDVDEEHYTHEGRAEHLVSRA